MWLWLFQQVLGAGKCHWIFPSLESGGAAALLRTGLDGPKFLGSFLGGLKSLLHLLLLLLKSRIHCFEPVVLVSSVSILPFWKARWRWHTRGIPTGTVAHAVGAARPQPLPPREAPGIHQPVNCAN